MQIELLNDDGAEWDEYVKSSPLARGAHLAGWRDVIEQSFGHKCYYLFARKHNKIVGILPLVLMQSRLFGKFLISVPYLNYGGICAENTYLASSLLEKAIELAKTHSVAHIEFRHTGSQKLELPGRGHKVAMILNLPKNWQQIWHGFKPKLRNTLRRAQKYGLTCKIGGVEQLDAFYKIFAHNMRDLGTPVYDKIFFEKILHNFPKQTHILVTFYQKKPVAAGLLFGKGNVLEIPWASSLRRYNRLNGNSLMYWTALKLSCEQGYTQFDFGRCTPGDGTYHFKKQWGAQPLEYSWQYWLANGDELPDISPQNPKYQIAIQAWQRLPVFLSRIIGPHIVKNIP